jgi:hypothetical protein
MARELRLLARRDHAADGQEADQHDQRDCRDPVALVPQGEILQAHIKASSCA